MLLRTQSGPVVTLSLDRPEVLNALSPALVQKLYKEVRNIAQDDSVHILVLTGKGRAFSAGVDLKAMKAEIDGGLFTADDILKTGNALIKTLQEMPQVTIAMVNGHCYTGAMEIMLAFDLIVAADEAKIGDTHAKWGILPKWGMSQRLAHQVGLRKAMELSFTAAPIDGKEAAHIGLVNRSVPRDQLNTAVEELCHKILANSPQTIAAMKQLYYKGAYGSLKKGIEFEAQFQANITDRKEFLQNFEQNK